jgi:hypothetical protein
MDTSRDAARFRGAARSLTLAFVLALTLAAPAWASVASEQREGAQILGKLHAGQLEQMSLSSSQYQQLGEYLMGQALGSTSAHERMNSLMGQTMGSTAVNDMHAYLGERYLGKSARISSRYASMYGLIGMMARFRGSSLANMMSGYLDDQSQSAGSDMMGYGTVSSANSNGGWPTGALVATALLAALLLAGILGFTVARLRGRGRGALGAKPRDRGLRAGNVT